MRIERRIRVILISALASIGMALSASEPGGTPVTHRLRIPKASAVRLQLFKADPPEVALGERLFLETRFAQFFFAHAKGDANGRLTEGDPVQARSFSASGETLPGPFAG